MTKKEILKNKLAMLDINPLPRFGVKKEKGRIRFSTPIQPGYWPREEGEWYSKIAKSRGEAT